MESYKLILRAGEESLEIYDIKGQRVPVIGETFSLDTTTIQNYIQERARKDLNMKYINEIAHSRFRVQEVEHVLRKPGKSIESFAVVSASKIE